MLKKVLITEDSSLQAKMYKSVFKKYADCELVLAANGIEALDKLKNAGDFDLIVLDINMPLMNGLTFLNEMKKLGYKKIPTIVVTTDDHEDDVKAALAAGATAYIMKPWTIAQLHSIIDKIFPDKLFRGGI